MILKNLMEDYRDLEELAKIVKKRKQKGDLIVFTNGCFDILHRGHVDILEKAVELGDVLIVGLNSDKSVGMLKGKNRPIKTELDRAYIMESMRAVDYVIIFDEDTPLNLLKKLQPDFNIKGGTSIPERVAEEERVMYSYGGKIIYVPLVEGYSTTKIIDGIRNGE